MQKFIKNVIIIVAIFILSLGINFYKVYAATNNIKSIWSIDTNLDGTIYRENGLTIQGWILSTQANSKLEVYIDGTKLDDSHIKYSRKYDLISIIQGYGTYEENPLPNFDIHIPIEEFDIGTYELEIRHVTEDGQTILQSMKKEIYVTRDIKHILCVDTKLEGQVFDKSGIKIEGWRLATEPNTKLQILIDGQPVEFAQEDKKLYDLISIIQGYGTYEENPLPNYKINIPTTNLTDGKHKLEIEFLTEKDELLEKHESEIIIEKVRHMLHVDTNLQGQVFGKDGIQIEGWRLATEANTKLEIKIDGEPVEFTQEDKKLYDLISIIQGYGTYKENPLPNYKINIPTTNLTDGKHKLEIEFLTANNELLEKYETQIITEKIKHMLHVDTKLEGQKFDKYGITIEGWRLATEPNTKLQIEIDGSPVEFTQEDKKLYDLISIIQGYGTYKENPLPNYKINIPTTNLANGKYKLAIKFMTENGEILETHESQIIIDKSIKHMLHIDTNLDTVVFNENNDIYIAGWKLATEPNTEIKILIDGQEVEPTRKKYSLKYDLISIVQGYGTYEENPSPNFDILIETSQFTRNDHQVEIQLIAPDGVTVLRTTKFTAKYGDKYEGIDVSRFNTVTNWNEVAQSGIDYVMIRFGYRGYRTPNIVLDSKALEYIKGAKQAGLKVGIYFVTQAINEQEAEEEALWVINQLRQNGIQLDYPIALDTEDSGATSRGEEPGRADLLDKQTRTKICKTFLDVIQSNGYKAMIYANSYWYGYHLEFSELSNYEIWLAHYTHNENVKPDFSGNYHMWQYTDKGSIPGITGAVDLNSCYKKY